jgi:BirA family biotin operon repressor/biotin-[acetyl-CoA-carboxylase] ligase
MFEAGTVIKSLKKNKVLNKIIFFDSIDSTSSFLKNNKFPTGTIVAAEEQSAGRGKHGAKWASGKGGLWFSFVINRKIKNPYDFVMLSAVAVMEALGKYGVKAMIKWPNDILVSGKKIAGILIENDYYGGRLVTGIGVNVNNRVPKNAGRAAVSLKQATGRSADIGELFAGIVKKLDRYIGCLRLERGAIIRKWINNQSELEGQDIKYIKHGKTIKANVIKIMNGKIKVRDAKGKTMTLNGDVFFI